jgi:hypothetical protein
MKAKQTTGEMGEKTEGCKSIESILYAPMEIAQQNPRICTIYPSLPIKLHKTVQDSHPY